MNREDIIRMARSAIRLAAEDTDLTNFDQEATILDRYQFLYWFAKEVTTAERERIAAEWDGHRNRREMMNDPVNHPKHYTSHPSGIECIQITEHMGFNLGNAVKYLFRRDDKNAPIEDIRKARWYIDREIERKSTEVWAVWPSDSRYEVSSAGKVRRCPGGNIRKLVRTPNGYLTFGTFFRGKHHTHYIHRVVAETFFGVIPEGMHVCHHDGDPTNNHVTNLRIDSVKNNHADKVKHGTRNWGARNGQARLTAEDVIQIRQSAATEESLASEFGVTRATIGRIRRGEAWVDRRHNYDVAFEEYLCHEPPSDIKSALELIWSGSVEDLRKARWYIEREIAKRVGVKPSSEPHGD